MLIISIVVAAVADNTRSSVRDTTGRSDCRPSSTDVVRYIRLRPLLSIPSWHDRQDCPAEADKCWRQRSDVCGSALFIMHNCSSNSEAHINYNFTFPRPLLYFFSPFFFECVFVTIYFFIIMYYHRRSALMASTDGHFWPVCSLVVCQK